MTNLGQSGASPDPRHFHLSWLTLLFEISLKEFRRHLLRNILTVTGIVLGVAIFTAVRSANSSLRTALSDTIDQVAGRTVLEVSAGKAGVPEDTVDRVREVQGVSAAVPVIEAVVRTADAAQGNILILGVDMAGDRSLRDYRIEGDEEAVADPLVFLAQPDSIMVSKEFASRNGLATDSRIELITGLGKKTFSVRGIMAAEGMAKAFGGNVAVMDIYSAQFVFGRGRSFDRIDVAIGAGQKTSEVQARIAQHLGPGFTVEPPIRRGRQTESLIEAFSQGLLFTSMLSLAIGLFLIFNSFAISVTQRRAQIGILRALGVTRREVQRLFLGESLVLGLVGSVVGVGAGIVMGRGLVAFMARTVETTHGVFVRIDRVRVEPLWLGISVGLGLAASLIGAWLPARAAGRVEPALALQKGKHQVLSLGENRARKSVGLLMMLAALGFGSSPWVGSLFAQIGVFALLFSGLALLVPTFSHLLAQLLRAPIGWAFGMEGCLASDSLVQAPRRTSATVSALMFSLAFVLTVGSFSVSVKTSMLKWVDFAINSDLFVAASQSLTARTMQFPPEVGDALKRVPGVRQVESVRLLNIDYAGSSPLLATIEMDLYLKRAKPMMEEGRVEDLLPEMLGKNGVVISNNFARLYRLGRGDRLQLDTPTGRHNFAIAGVQVDYTADTGSILLDRQVYRRLWKDDRVDTFDLMLEKGADPERVRAEIYRRLADSHSVFVLTNKDMRREIFKITDQFLVLQYVQVVIAVFVAVLGIVNSLIVSITERKRELAVLRSLGGERRQVRKAILLEAACIGVVASVLGLAAGAIMGYYMLGSFSANINGWVFPYMFPWGMAAMLIPGVVLISLVAAWYPSSLALRAPLVEALAYE